MIESRLTKNFWILEMHYLIGEGGKVRYEKEVHKLIKADKEDYEKALRAVNFKDLRFLKEGLWENSRGLFIAFK